MISKDPKVLDEISTALMGDGGGLAEVVLKHVEGRGYGCLATGMEELKVYRETRGRALIPGMGEL